MLPRPARCRGFTLLEVMIVVGIAALILAISVPFVQRTFKRDAVYKAVHVVEDAILNARATAIFNNSATDLVIRPEDRSLSVRANVAPPPASSLMNQNRGLNPGGDTWDGDPDGRGPTPEQRGRARDFSRHAPKPFSGSLEDDVTIELLDVNFQEFKDREEAHVRFHPNGTSDEFTIVMKIGATAVRKITLDVVTALPTLETLR
ncbi:MAG: Tfp pilus assembly protein FimT/FimU [Limisphaerales bacterium]